MQKQILKAFLLNKSKLPWVAPHQLEHPHIIMVVFAAQQPSASFVYSK